MSTFDNATDRNDPWNHEQAPFAGAETPAELGHATAEASAAPQTYTETYAAAEPVPAAAPGQSAYGSYAPANPAGSAAGQPGGPNWVPVSGPYGTPPPPPGVTPIMGAPGSTSVPNPGLAFILGLIPGVGAMYNGQVAKGIVHLIVFAVLVTLANDVNDIFGIFVAGWIFFQAFEAYHTAKARRDGLPLPNAFGWNDIGERVGLGKNWPFGPPAPTGTVPQAAASAAWAAAQPVPPDPTVNPYGSVAPNWAGYVPPTAFASAPPVGTAGYTAPYAATPGASGSSVSGSSAYGSSSVPPGQPAPYADVHAGPPYTPYAPGVVPPTPSRLPVGAIWLIGLGILFLIGQWAPMLNFGRVWVPSVVLAGLAALLFARRMGWTGTNATVMSAMPMSARIAGAIRMPGALLAIAVLNGLHEAWILRWNRSWPVLLIVIGALMLTERVVLRSADALDGPPANPADNSILGGR